MTLLSRSERNAWIASSSLPIADASIIAVYRPTTVADLQGALAEASADACAPLPVGAQHEWGRHLRGDLAVILTEDLEGSVQVNRSSQTARIPAGTTWSGLEEQLSDSDLSVRHIVDAFDDATVGGALSRRGWLPPTWRSSTARAEVSGISGVTHQGVVYRGVTAPRTASGPDLRSAFIDGEGRFGTITAATVNLCRRSSTRWFQRASGPSAEGGLAALITRYSGLVSVRWPTKRGLALSVCGDNALVSLAITAVKELGFEEAPWPKREAPRRALLVTAPWSLLSTVRHDTTTEVVAATATHVVVARVVAESEPLDEAYSWAQAMAASSPLVRATGIGVPMPSDRHRLTRTLGQQWQNEEAK